MVRNKRTIKEKIKMKKKLVIKFWKAERALVMQILKQEGLPIKKHDSRVRILDYPQFYDEEVALRGNASRFDLKVVIKDYFNSNRERDEYLDNVINAITDELFTSGTGLKVGEMCEMSDNELVWEKRIFAGKSAKQLGLEKRFLALCNNDYLTRYAYARPLAKRTEPKVEENGEVITYTWEG